MLLRRLHVRRASSQAPRVVLVDGRRSLELVRAELALATAAHAAHGVELYVAGRQGIAIALRAAALLRPASSGQQAFFALDSASAEELAAAGLEPMVAPSARDSEDAAVRGRGFCMRFPPRELDYESKAAPTIEHVMKVGQNTRVLSLAKAIATTVSRLPQDGGAVVETALYGKSKNRWTRTHLMAQAVAMAHHWQESPSPNLERSARPFRCLASQLQVSESKRDADAEVDVTSSSEEVVAMDVLRLLLVPTGPPTSDK